MAETTDWSQQFHDLFNSAVGKEVLRVLEEDLHKSKIEDAEKADSLEKGYGLLKEASGIMLAVSHLKSKTVVPKTRRNEGA
jgi:hypothetical protein